MQAITTIGLDIAKSVFQVHGIDAAGKVLIRRPLNRRYVLASSRSAAVLGWYRGLCHVASLVARAFSRASACTLLSLDRARARAALEWR